MKHIDIALVGFGTVGRGLVKILADRQKWLLAEHGITVGFRCLSTARIGSRCSKNSVSAKTLYEATAKLSHKQLPATLSMLFPIPLNQEQAVEKKEVDTVVELATTNLSNGGPSLATMRHSLAAGKNVITANKGPIALHYNELKRLASENDAQLGIEGTVMSGTPVFNMLRHGLVGNPIESMHGVLNGTTNFILEKMEQGIDFANALANATDLGYAEADPSGDIDGWDTLAKLAILGAVFGGKQIPLSTIPRTGISDLTDQDFALAAKQGKRIKLVGRVKFLSAKTRKTVIKKIISHSGDKNDEEERLADPLNAWDTSFIEASVKPEFLSPSDPCYSVDGVHNALVVESSFLGRVKIEGPGAGKQPTAYAVFNDLITQQSTTLKSKANV